MGKRSHHQWNHHKEHRIYNCAVITSSTKCKIITVTSWWPRWRLKSPASPLFTQPFIQMQIKKTHQIKLHVTGLCAGNSRVTGEFPAQMVSNAGKMFPFDYVIMSVHMEDILTFKHIINDSNLDIILYYEFQYLWKLTSVLLILICLGPLYCFILRRVSGPVLLLNYEWFYETFSITFHWFCHICVCICIYICECIYIFIQYCGIYYKDFHVFCIYVHICTVYFVCTGVLYKPLANFFFLL